MSLRKKIILLFIGLSVVPLLLLAALGYWQAQSLLTSTLHDRLAEGAVGMGRTMAGERAGIQGSLEALALDLNSGGDLGGTWVGQPPASVLPPPLSRAVFLQVVDRNGVARGELGALPEEPVRRGGGGTDGLVRFSAELPASQGWGTLTAGFWASDLLSSLAPGRAAEGSVVVLDTRIGTVLLAEGMGTLSAGDPVSSVPGLARILQVTEGKAERLRLREAGQHWLGAAFRIPASGWVVVSISDASAALTPLNRLLGLYWAFVLGLALSTALTFSFFLGHLTRALRELSCAAELIGEGELDPWLPLPTSGEVGQLTLAFNRMLGRLREMMSQVNQSGRLAVVGQLSAYFAHEIRTPLSSVKLNLQRLRRWVQQGTVPAFCLEPLEISLREVDRLSASVTEVLQLSRTPESPAEVVSLHHQVEEAGQLLEGRFRGQGVKVKLELDARADRVLARPGQVKSVILNLMVNALEAQPRGGYLEIRSELVSRLDLGGPAVAVHFKDGGTGVPADIRERIFEPFFTTKTRGSGIGLAVASRCVQDNGGLLYLEPSLSTSSGAEFVMAFPLAALENGSGSGRGELHPGLEEHLSRAGPSSGVSSSTVPGIQGLPHHLRTPEGLRALMSLSLPEREEMN